MKRLELLLIELLLLIVLIHGARLSLRERVMQHMRSKQYLMASDQPCMGIPAATCLDCASGMPMCSVMEHMCNLNFCHPICTTETWTVTTEATGPGPTEGFKDEVNSDLVNKALEAEFKTWGCVERMKCCDRNVMWDWLENHVFQEEYPKATLPIDACSHFTEDAEAKAAFCDACKQSVKVTAKDIECDLRMRTPADGADPSWHSIGAFMEEDARAYMTSTRHEPYLALDDTGKKFTIRVRPVTTPRQYPSALLHDNSNTNKKRLHHHKRRGQNTTSSSGNGGGAYTRLRALLEQKHGIRAIIDTGVHTDAKAKGYEVGPPVHKSFYFRCNIFHNVVKGLLPVLEAEFQERVCGCLGCCQDIDCFYNVGVNKINDVPIAGNTLGFLQ